MHPEPVSPFRRAVAVLVRIVCYGALAAIVVALATLALLSALNLCPRLGEAAIVCPSPVLQVVAETAMSFVLVTVYAGFPLILPLVGLILLAADIRRLRRA